MKKQILLLAGVFFLMPLILMAQNSTISSGKLTPAQMTGSMAKGLYGKVKTVTNSDGLTITFNNVGNITSKRWKDGSKAVYAYRNQFQYTIDGHGAYKISFADNKRIETDTQEPECPEHYIFDNQGRLVEAMYAMWPSMVTEKYAYAGSEKLPRKMTLEHYDEMGTYHFTYLYEYISVDSHGNWTKRKVAATLKSTEYVEDSSDKVNIEKKNLVETRTITYYP